MLSAVSLSSLLAFASLRSHGLASLLSPRFTRICFLVLSNGTLTTADEGPSAAPTESRITPALPPTRGKAHTAPWHAGHLSVLV
uniref:Putative secreted protein n=1 Tax=Anopheles darlingi TaxID=43151 RepID=A0A2M4DIA8_ANODA